MLLLLKNCTSSSYSESQRHYHTLRHIQDCFAAKKVVFRDVVPGMLPRCVRAIMALSIWFHDAIYDPKDGCVWAVCVWCAWSVCVCVALLLCTNRDAGRVYVTHHGRFNEENSALLFLRFAREVQLDPRITSVRCPVCNGTLAHGETCCDANIPASVRSWLIAGTIGRLLRIGLFGRKNMTFQQASWARCTRKCLSNSVGACDPSADGGYLLTPRVECVCTGTLAARHR